MKTPVWITAIVAKNGSMAYRYVCHCGETSTHPAQSYSIAVVRAERHVKRSHPKTSVEIVP